MTLIAGCLETRVWLPMKSSVERSYPNIYTLLVGHPGTGKSAAIKPVQYFWSQLNLKQPDNSVTKPALVDCLKNAPQFRSNGEAFSHLNAAISEWGVFMHKRDDEMNTFLTRMYDVEATYTESRRTTLNKVDGQITLAFPSITLIGGIQPSFFNVVYPITTIAQGIQRRFILIWAENCPKKILYAYDEDIAELDKALQLRDQILRDLRAITMLEGSFKIALDARPDMERFALSGGYDSAPKHLKLKYYKEQRSQLLDKLCMICSAARSQDLTIRKVDFDMAHTLLIEAEENMHMCYSLDHEREFESMVGDAYQHISDLYYGNKRQPVPERLIREFFINRKVFPARISEYLDEMVNSGRVVRTARNVTQLRPGSTAVSETITVSYYTPAE